MTVAVPKVPDAVNSPVGEITPLLVVHVTVGWLAMAAPNWSNPQAVNCCVASVSIDDVNGITVILLSVWFTVTVTLLVTLRLPGSVMVTVKVYVPAA